MFVCPVCETEVASAQTFESVIIVKSSGRSIGRTRAPMSSCACGRLKGELGSCLFESPVGVLIANSTGRLSVVVEGESVHVVPEVERMAFVEQAVLLARVKDTMTC